MEKTVAIVQSNYVPWKGYFDLINLADEFILLDEVQYTRRDWRNRNRVKTPGGVIWLTIPVKVKGRRAQRIDETEVADPHWGRRHWEAIRSAYRRTPGFEMVQTALEPLYLLPQSNRLTTINESFLAALCPLLGITTPITRSTDYAEGGARTDRLVRLCRAAGATRYISGPAARAYLDESAFAGAGITLSWMDYSGYRTYDQPYGDFDHHVSIIDLLCCVGGDAAGYLKSYSPDRIAGAVR